MPADTRSHPTIPKIELALLSASVLEALNAGSIDRASAAFGRPLPPTFLDHSELWGYRIAQVQEDPSTLRWLVRAVIDASSGDNRRAASLCGARAASDGAKSRTSARIRSAAVVMLEPSAQPPVPRPLTGLRSKRNRF